MMTKDQIVTALITCATKHCADRSCPYYESHKCYDILMLDAADCILLLLRDNMDLSARLEKQKLISDMEANHHAEQTDKV